MEISLDEIKESESISISRWKSDKHLSENIMSVYSETSVIEAKKWIKKCNSDCSQKLFGIFIGSKNDSKLIGITRLMYIDSISLNCEFGIYIGESEFTGKGLGKKATQKTLDIAFNQMNMNKVYLKVNTSNVKAINLYNQIGFINEGLLKKHYFRNQLFYDIKLMAIEKNK